MIKNDTKVLKIYRLYDIIHIGKIQQNPANLDMPMPVCYNNYATQSHKNARGGLIPR